MKILVALPLVGIGCLVLFGLMQFSIINDGVKRIYDDNVVPMISLKEINDSYKNVIDAINKADNGLILPNEALSTIQESKQQIIGHWEEFTSSNLREQEKQIAIEAAELFRDADDGIQEVSQVLKSMGNELTWDEYGETPLTDYNGDFYDRIDPISEKISELIEFQMHSAENERKKSLKVFSQTRFSFIGIASVSFLILSVFGWLVSISISRPLIRLKNSIEKAEEDRDLRVFLEVEYEDEIGQVAHAYIRMMNRFWGIIRNVKHATEHLQNNAKDLSENTVEARSNTDEQMRDTDAVANAIYETKQATEEVSKRAQHAAVAADEAKDESGNGMLVVERTIEAINTLSQEVNNAGQDITRVSQDSESIGTILDVIRGVADQTNLLALNAAIEAARAGEQGRGFAVVADEVRSLAQRTQESTEEIQEMIERLQKGAREAVTNMESGSEKMITTLNEAEKAKTSFSSITNSINLINDMNHQIAAATEQQITTSQEVSSNAENIAELCRKTNSTAELVDQSSQEINQVASELNAIISEFKF